MQILSEPTAKRTGKILSWSSSMVGLARVLGAILFLALLHNPVPVLGVTLPVSYSVTLAWNPSISTNVVGYNVYYGLASGVYSSVKSVTGSNTTITGLAAGTTYHFAATAVDALGVESPFSNETSYTTGVPTVRIRTAPAGQFVLTASTSAPTRPMIRTAPAGQFVLTVSGLIGQTYEVEATQDLATWSAIGTVTLGASGSSDFTDTNAASFPQRFYCTRETP
jgi:hypothetical protein